MAALALEELFWSLNRLGINRREEGVHVYRMTGKDLFEIRLMSREAFVPSHPAKPRPKQLESYYQ